MLDATPILKLYARWRLRRLAAQNAVAVQRQQLLRLVRQAANTRFGRDHDFAAIDSVDDFQARVPLRRYEDFWRDYWQADFPILRNVSWPGTIPYFAVTSGTTSGTTKYIPCSAEMNAANRKAAADVLVHHVANRPNSRIMAGRNFLLGGSTDLQQLAPGVQAGDLSGIATAEMPFWARRRAFPPRELALMQDWETKIDRLAPLSLEADIRSISGTPSWLLLFFDKLRMVNPGWDGRLASLYPRLELIIHGGVNFAPYATRFAQLLEQSDAELREVYPASEGFIAVADRGPGEGLRLLSDVGLFFEFVPVEELDSPTPTRHWLATMEKGVNYAVVLSSCAGLWGYVLGDTVRFTDLDPPRLMVTGRTAYTLSAFGEHLIDEEIEMAVTRAADAIGAMVTDYSVGALFPDGERTAGAHLFVVEFADGVPAPDRIERFARLVDTHLAETNDDYREHRAGDFSLGAPRVRAVPPGSFAAWMKSRGKIGGQNKVPRIINDTDLFDNLCAFMGGM